MHLTTFTIEKFRGIKKLVLELDRTTVLIGENNSGKSSVLEALHLAMSRSLGRKASPFGEYDHHLATADSEPSMAPAMVLTLVFTESKKDEWPDEVVQALEKAVQVRKDDRQQVTFQIKSEYDKKTNDFLVEWSFLDLSDNAMTGAKNPRNVSELQQLNPVFLLAAVRDAGQHFHPKGSFWAPFLKNPSIDEKTRESLEEQIESINQTILDSHAPFEEIKKGISKAGKLLPLAAKDLVSVEAIPAKVFDMLARTQVKLASKGGAKLPVTQHGAGTQSLSVLFLFEAFLIARLAEAYDKHSEPILALEEPEAHLHPSAIRSLWAMIEALKGQKVVASHSGDLLAAVPLKSIRRLARKDGEIQVFRLGEKTLTDKDERKIGYHVRAKRGSLLFARCWLLIEGESEFWLLPELAKVAGFDFELEGICCVEFAQCGIECLIKVATDFGIEWHCLADGDPAGQQYAITAKTQLGKSKESDRITMLAEKDIEHSLFTHGYSAVYESNVPAGRLKSVTDKPGTPAYMSKVIEMALSANKKPFMAVAVADEASKPKSPGVPPTLKTAIETAVTLARSMA